MPQPRTLLCVLFVLGLGSIPVRAGVDKGDLEIDFRGGVSREDVEVRSEFGGFGAGNNSEGWFFSGTVSAGFFVTRRIDVGGLFRLGYSDADGDRYGYTLSLGPSVNYHFRPSTMIVPFVGVGAGGSRGRTSYEAGFDTDSKGWFAEGRGGADFFLNEHVAIKLAFLYVRDRVDTDQGPFTIIGVGEFTVESNQEVTLLSTNVGLSIFLDRRDQKRNRP